MNLFLLLISSIIFDFSEYFNWKVVNLIFAGFLLIYSKFSILKALNYKKCLIGGIYLFFQFLFVDIDNYLFGIEFCRVIFGVVFFCYLDRNKTDKLYLFGKNTVFAYFLGTLILAIYGPEFGIYTDASLLCLVFHYEKYRRSWLNIITGLLAVSITIYYSEWRAVQVGLIVSFFVWGFMLSKRSNYLIKFISTFLAVIFVGYSIPTIKHFVKSEVTVQNSRIDSQRFHIWNNFIAKYLNADYNTKLLGTGLGNSANLLWYEMGTVKMFTFKADLNVNGEKTTLHPHNLIIWMFVELGLIGTVILSLTLINSLSKCKIKMEALSFFLTLGFFSGGGYFYTIPFFYFLNYSFCTNSVNSAKRLTEKLNHQKILTKSA